MYYVWVFQINGSHIFGVFFSVSAIYFSVHSKINFFLPLLKQMRIRKNHADVHVHARKWRGKHFEHMLTSQKQHFFQASCVCFFLTLEPAGGEQCYKVHTHSGTVSYNTAESSQAESDDSASQCELLLLRLLTGDAAIYSEGSFNGLFHYVTFNGAMAD